LEKQRSERNQPNANEENLKNRSPYGSLTDNISFVSNKGENMKRIFLVSLLLLAGANVAFGQSTAYPDSAKIEKLFDDYFREYLILNPQKGSELGLSIESGYDFDRAALDDYSHAGIKANFDLTRKYLDELSKIDQNKITKSQSIDAKILTWFLEVQLEGEKFVDHKYYIDHLFGVHSQFVNLMTAYHTVGNLQDAYDYLSRLEKFPVQLRQTMERIDDQEEEGIHPPVRGHGGVQKGRVGFQHAVPRLQGKNCVFIKRKSFRQGGAEP
jgi:uncharacterized protein (DUF885 family)